MASNDVDGAAAGPLAAFRVELRPAAPHRRGGDALVVFARAEKNLPDLEQRDIAEAPAGVALGRGDKPRNEARAHVGEISRDRVGERERGRAAAERFRRHPGDERPGHCFAQGERGQRALGEPGALLHEREDGFGRALVEPGQGRGRGAVDAGDAQNLLDDIGLHLNVGAPRGDEHMRPFDAKAQPAKDGFAFLARDIDAEEPPDLAIGEGDRTPRR